MDAQRARAPRVREHLDGVERIRVHAREGPARRVRPDGDQPEVEGPAQRADLLELRVARQVRPLVRVVVLVIRHLRHRAVARVAAEPDRARVGPGAGRDRPRRPQRLVEVPAEAARQVLRGQAGDLGRDGAGGLDVRVEARVSLLGPAVGEVHRQLGVLPPVQLGDVVDAARGEPLLDAQPHEEVSIGEALVDLEHGRVREMVIVVVADDDGVEEWKVCDRAGLFGEPLRAHEAERGASFLEDGIKEHP